MIYLDMSSSWLQDLTEIVFRSRCESKISTNRTSMSRRIRWIELRWVLEFGKSNFEKSKISGNRQLTRPDPKVHCLAEKTWLSWTAISKSDVGNGVLCWTFSFSTISSVNDLYPKRRPPADNTDGALKCLRASTSGAIKSTTGVVTGGLVTRGR